MKPKMRKHTELSSLINEDKSLIKGIQAEKRPKIDN